MANMTVTISTAGAITNGAKWCIKGVTGWLASGATGVYTWTATSTISFRYAEDYLTPSDVTITTAIRDATTYSQAYTATHWLSTWGPPVTGCIYNGQILLGGSAHSGEVTFPSDSRIIRWSEIGAFRFLGATANPMKNEAGFTYTREHTDETVMCILPLKNAVVVYSTMSILLLTPMTQPAVGYGVDEFLIGVGILNPLAVAGNRNSHLFVDREGHLRHIGMGQYGKGYEHKDLGYSHIFGPMQDGFSMTTGKGLIAIVHNPDEDEYYISNGERSFVYKGEALTEIGAAITSYANIRTTFLSNELFEGFQEKYLGGITQLLNSEYAYLETDVLDFGVSAIKTIQQVELGASFGADASAQVMIKYRYNRSDKFRETEWRRCSPNGVCTPIVSGTDFKVCIRISPTDGLIINNMTIEWKTTDRSSIRGNNASSNAS
jgi:hypothetical protein